MFDNVTATTADKPMEQMGLRGLGVWVKGLGWARGWRLRWGFKQAGAGGIAHGQHSRVWSHL